MRRALLSSALSMAVIACGSPTGTPKTSLPTISDAPSLEEHILVCGSTDDATSLAVSRCVASDVDPDALASTISRWGRTQLLFSDALFDTASFSKRYPLHDSERDCLRRAICRPMPFEER